MVGGGGFRVFFGFLSVFGCVFMCGCLALWFRGTVYSVLIVNGWLEGLDGVISFPPILHYAFDKEQ